MRAELKALVVAGAAVTVVSAAACHGQADALMSPADAETLMALAPELTVENLADELHLAPEQRAEFGAKLEQLHASMQEVHSRMPASIDGMTEAELQALHLSMQEAMDGVQQGHHALLETLTPEQQELFARHVHAKMQEHHDAMGLEPPHDAHIGGHGSHTGG